MKKIVFLSNWGEPPAQILKRYSKQTPNNSGIWNNIIGVDNIKDADFYIILEGFNQKLPQDKTISIKREPKFINNTKPNYQNIITWDDSNCGITWWVNKSYDELKSMEYPEKSKKVSCVVSSKHNHRLNYVKSLFIGKSLIDLYGIGHDKGYYNDHYKGPLMYDGNCKLRGLIDYEYSIVLENSQEKNYFTEKLADALLSWSVPLYWGCPNMHNFFPKNSYFYIDINSKTPMEDINRLIEQPIDMNALNVARKKILDEFNIWEIISKKLNKYEVLQSV